MSEKALQVWPGMVEYLKFVTSLAPRKGPNVMICQFSSSKEVVGLLNEFLQQFYTDSLMTPFLCDALEIHFSKFMKIIYSSE